MKVAILLAILSGEIPVCGNTVHPDVIAVYNEVYCQEGSKSFGEALRDGTLTPVEEEVDEDEDP